MNSASEEAPATTHKKKKNGMANSVAVKADRIDAIANEFKQKHGEKCSQGSTRLGQKLSHTYQLRRAATQIFFELHSKRTRARRKDVRPSLTNSVSSVSCVFPRYR